MKTFALTLTFLAGLPLAVMAQVTKEDLKKLAAAGISDDVILSYVKANGPVVKLTAEDVIELKQAGASEKLLSAVLAGASSAPAPEQRTTVIEKQVVAAPQTTTYVYDSNPYYYVPSYPYTSSVYYSGYCAPNYYYPRSYYSPRYYSSSYYSSSCYPRTSYYSPSIRVGFSGSRHHSSSRGSIGVSGYRR